MVFQAIVLVWQDSRSAIEMNLLGGYINVFPSELIMVSLVLPIFKPHLAATSIMDSWLLIIADVVDTSGDLLIVRILAVWFVDWHPVMMDVANDKINIFMATCLCFSCAAKRLRAC